MIYSINHNFIFIHCPRTSGTSLSLALKLLVKDAVYNDLEGKHKQLNELPFVLSQLRSFTIYRPYNEIRTSYYHHIIKVYNNLTNNDLVTKWFLEHAKRIANMSLKDYLLSNEEPINTDIYKLGVDQVFEYHKNPYNEIAKFCNVDPVKLIGLMKYVN